MIIYRLSIVKRDLPYSDPQSKIIDFVDDYEFRLIRRLEAKLQSLIKQGYTKDQIDITTWDKDTFNDDYDLRDDPQELIDIINKLHR